MLRDTFTSARLHRTLPSRPVLLRLALVLLLIVAVTAVLSSHAYRVTGGSVSFRLRPAWPGGRLVMPLGPAGEFALRTHHMPFEIVMAYELPSALDSLSPERLGPALPTLQTSARDAFSQYLLSRVPWLLLAGAAGGALVAGTGAGRRRLLLGPLAGVVAVVLVAGGLTLLTFATVDRTPAVEYRGLASNITQVLPLVRALGAGGGQSDDLGRLADFVDGLEAVATQLTRPPQLLPRERVVRLLLVSDVHDNVFGMRAAARLAGGGGDPVDAVLIAGDVTNLGTRGEAELFLRGFSASGAEVLLVGGNHEDRPAMATFRRAGYRVLAGDTAGVAGVTVLGDSDPLAESPQVDSDQAALEAAAARLLWAWRWLPDPPHVVLVHDLKQARLVAEAARERGDQLIVAYGNDHVAGVRRDGGVTFVDAGTGGASGYEDIGGGRGDDNTFQLIDFSRGELVEPLAVTTLRITQDGRTLVEYTPLL